MGQIFTNNTVDLELINNQTGHATPGTGLLGSGSIGLVNSSTVTLGRTTALADLVANEGGYPGYKRQAITWNGASVADDGTVEAVGVVPEFRPTGSSTMNMYGMFMTGTDSVTLIGCGPLDGAPTPLIDANSAIVVTVRWRPTTQGLSVDVT